MENKPSLIFHIGDVEVKPTDGLSNAEREIEQKYLAELGMRDTKKPKNFEVDRAASYEPCDFVSIA